MDFNYKKYSLEQFENWLHDSLSCDEISAQEIYDTIKNVIQEEHDIYKARVDHCSKLLDLLNVRKTESKVTKWVLPVQQSNIDGVDDYYIQLPDDLLNQVNWKDGDRLDWIDRGDGSFELRRVVADNKQFLVE